MTQTVHLIAAARPNFMKIAPLYHALSASAEFRPVFIHTGQHYDSNMSQEIVRELGLPAAEHNLGVGSGSHAEQTARVMIAYEKVALQSRPDWLVVAGDVNSTAACALVGAKLLIRTVHLEAGLRSNDRAMPEEINRLVTDVLCDVLWTPSPDADANLLAEGIPEQRITRVGNIMMDSLEMIRARRDGEGEARQHALDGKTYGLVTLHRPSNVDDPQQLAAMLKVIVAASERLPFVFPVHPRTRSRIDEFDLRPLLSSGNLKLIEPLPYGRFMDLLRSAHVAITDSGGLQEETTYLGIPCLTLRENTERPITVSEGTNQLVNAGNLLSALDRVLSEPSTKRPRPALWDGRTAHRCVEDLRRRSNSA